MVHKFDPGSLPVPGWLRDAVTAPEGECGVFGQPVAVDRAWWSERLAACGLPEDLIVADRLTRRELFALGEGASAGPEGAERLLWNAIVWGLASSTRQVPRRILAYSADRDGFAADLRAAAVLGRTDARAAYANLRGLIQYIGPAFFTKFLYFAGGGDPGHPGLILDARVAMGLREAGWTAITLAGWSAPAYGDYLDLVERWSAEIGADRRDRVECALRAESFRLPAGRWRTAKPA